MPPHQLAPSNGIITALMGDLLEQRTLFLRFLGDTMRINDYLFSVVTGSGQPPPLTGKVEERDG